MNFKLYILVVLCGLASCKNSPDNNEADQLTMKEQPLVDTEPIIEMTEVLQKEEDIEEDEKSEATINSIFDHGMNIVYIKKEDLSESELASLKSLMENDPKISEAKLIQDIGGEFSLDLPSIKSSMKASDENYEKLKSILERNISPASVSKGFEIDGRERIREYTGDRSGGFIEDMTEYYMFKGRRTGGTALRRLGVASKENIVPILQDYFEVESQELELLKSLPGTEKHSNSLLAQKTLNFELPRDIIDRLASAECSEGFKYAIDVFKERQVKAAKRFMQKADQAKADFYKLNPSWYGEDDDIGITYVDFRKKYIFLPLGALSFADRVISHDTGTEGGNSEGVLGEPDMALEVFRLKDPRIGNLGTNGVMTLEFTDNTLTDVNGPDLYVFEMGKIEPTKLEISKDGKKWIEIGKIEGGTAMVDIAQFVKPGETFNYIRLTDLDTWSTVPGADIDAVAAIGGALRLNLDSAVLFDTGEYQLKESASHALEKLLADIRQIPSGTVVIEGHTDNVGDPASNKKLSENRAREVSNFLKENLSKQYKFVVKGFGESQPVAPNDSEENKQKNRRVEILVMPSK